MKSGFLSGLLRIFCLLAVMGTSRSQAATETILHTFGYFPNGAAPCGTPIFDSSSNLYGTTYQGGASNQGTVFEREASGALKVLYSFQGGTDGSGPYAGVVLDSLGNLYGTTLYGGAANAGVVYKVTPSGQETVLYSFTGGADGLNPYAGVVLDPAGNLYGTTFAGGTGKAGVVYKVSPAGQETVLYSFTGGTDGGSPYGRVILDPEGNLYGTTWIGGAGKAGVVYKLTPSGLETVVYAFNVNNSHGGGPQDGLIRDAAGNFYGADSTAVYKIGPNGHYTQLAALNSTLTGGEPTAGLAMDSAGNLYGTTSGTYNSQTYAPDGVVYKVDTVGQVTVLYYFPGHPKVGTSGGNCPIQFANPGVVLDPLGNIYGASQNISLGGGLFKIDSAGKETTFYGFPPAPGGSNGFGAIIRDGSGNLYGTTGGGGPVNQGVLYKLSATGHEMALPPHAGNVGTTVARDPEGNLYVTGASSKTALGNIYKVAPLGEATVLYSFTGGADGTSSPGVIVDSAGNLYGTTSGGSAPNGAVFKLTPGGLFTVLYTFTGGSDGGLVNPELIIDSAGNLYGTTIYGGAGGGVVFRVSPSGQETVLHAFEGGAGGGVPFAGVIGDQNGNLFGTTVDYGAGGGAGVVYKLGHNGDYTVLYSFTGGAGGSSPFSGLVRDSAGNLYGTTAYGGVAFCPQGFGTLGCGVVFELDTAGVYTVLHTFSGDSDGSFPDTALVLDQAGDLYGATRYGGVADAGIIFKVSPQ